MLNLIPPASMRAVWAMLCVAWGFALGGCNHPMAQRSAWDWDATRVYVDNPNAYAAQARPLSKGGFYVLVRELSPRHVVTAGSPLAAEITQVYAERGDVLGFRRSADGGIVAVDGAREIVLVTGEGIHHIWYRESNDWASASNTLLITVLAVALIGGLVVLIANSDDRSVSASF